MFEDITDEDLNVIATSSVNINRIMVAIAHCRAKYEELDQLPRSMTRNRQRKFYDLTHARLVKRLAYVKNRQIRQSKDKQLRRLTSKATEEIVLKSLVTRLITAKGNKSNHPQIDLTAQHTMNTDNNGKFVSGDPQADASMTAIAQQFLAGKSFAQIAEEAKQRDINKANEKSVLDAFTENEKGEIEL